MSILANSLSNTTISVPFHGSELFVVNHNNEAFTPMKPIVEGMGMDWKSQYTKIKQRFAKGMVEITIPSAGGDQSMICLALRKLSAWLNTISPNKVKPEIRERVIQYQEECDDVLYEYWMKGQAINPRRPVGRPRKDRDGKITIEQQEAIKQLVLTRGKSVSNEHQAKATITLWSALKSHFGCTYKEINEDQFTEALSLAARITLEGEYIGKIEATPSMLHTPKLDYEFLTVIRNGTPTEVRMARPDERLMSFSTFKEIAERAGYLVVHGDDLKSMTIDSILRLGRQASKSVELYTKGRCMA